MKKKAKQICFDRFIDSLFLNVAPVINNHSIQHLCCSLCVPNGINLQFVRWNKHDQLETLTRSSVLIRAEAKEAEPHDGGAGGSRSNRTSTRQETSCQRNFNQLAKYRARNHIKHKRWHITHTHTHTSRCCYLLTRTDHKNLPVWTLLHIHLHTKFFFKRRSLYIRRWFNQFYMKHVWVGGFSQQQKRILTNVDGGNRLL